MNFIRLELQSSLFLTTPNKEKRAIRRIHRRSLIKIFFFFCERIEKCLLIFVTVVRFFMFRLKFFVVKHREKRNLLNSSMVYAIRVVK
jgi:hypothetical protein